MEEKIIEVEMRAEILPERVGGLKNKLESIGKLHSAAKRLSVMYFGEIDARKVDVRVRVTNGECEVVVKSGAFSSHDRTEISQKIDQAQFLGMVKIFAQFGLTMKIGERETLNYTLPGDITISIISAGSIVYVEFEKMSSASDVNQNKKRLEQIADELGLKFLGSEKEFDELCARLSASVDWTFNGTVTEFAKLSEILNRYLKKEFDQRKSG